MNKRVFYIFCVFFLFINCHILPAKDILDGEFELTSDSDYEVEDLFELEGELTFTLDLPKTMEICIGIEVDQFELNPQEISFRFGRKDRFFIRGGYEENAMTLEEYRRGFLRPINTDSLSTDYYEFLGYVARNIGFRIYRKHDFDDSSFPLSWWGKLSMSLPNIYEPQVEGGVLYHFGGENSYLGFFAVYLPYFVHSLAQDGDTVWEHYTAGTLGIANFGGPFLYSAWVATGVNMKDPLGLMPVPPGEDPGYFLGLDGLIGWQFKMKSEMLLITALQYSLLIPDISESVYHQQELVLGNQFYISSECKVFLDTGVNYTSSDGLLDVNDGWNWVWNLGIQISTRGIDLDKLFS
jgi:hypothetical protein